MNQLDAQDVFQRLSDNFSRNLLPSTIAAWSRKKCLRDVDLRDALDAIDVYTSQEKRDLNFARYLEAVRECRRRREREEQSRALSDVSSNPQAIPWFVGRAAFALATGMVNVQRACPPGTDEETRRKVRDYEFTDRKMQQHFAYAKGLSDDELEAWLVRARERLSPHQRDVLDSFAALFLSVRKGEK